jgi:hypothetical protein
MKYPVLPLILVSIIAVGCTTVTIKSPGRYHEINQVYIRKNPEVEVKGFIEILRVGFDRHGISSKIINQNETVEHGYIVTYTALRNWDIVMYMYRAEIRIEKDERIVASATYDLKGRGGLTLSKFASAKSKMDPVIDQLVAGIRNKR